MSMSSMPSSSSSHSPCAACKFQRRKCTQECIFAPYFPPDQPQKFTNVHRVYGASNVAKLLSELNAVHREDAVASLAYEAEARLRDPVYGCVGFISILQNRLRQVQNDLYAAKKELAAYIGPQPQPQPQPNPILNIQQRADYDMPMVGPSHSHEGQLQQIRETQPNQTHQHQEVVRSTFYSGSCAFDPLGFSNHQIISSAAIDADMSPSLATFDHHHQIQLPHQPPNYRPHHHPIDYQLQPQLLLHQNAHHKSDAAAADS